MPAFLSRLQNIIPVGFLFREDSQVQSAGSGSSLLPVGCGGEGVLQTHEEVVREARQEAAEARRSSARLESIHQAELESFRRRQGEVRLRPRPLDQ